MQKIPWKILKSMAKSTNSRLKIPWKIPESFKGNILPCSVQPRRSWWSGLSVRSSSIQTHRRWLRLGKHKMQHVAFIWFSMLTLKSWWFRKKMFIKIPYPLKFSVISYRINFVAWFNVKSDFYVIKYLTT